MVLSQSLSPSIFLDTHMSRTPKPAGLLKGKGTATSDSIPAKLSKGEYVIPAAVVKHYGVKKGMPHMAGGGDPEELLKAKKPNFTMQPNYEGTIPPNKSLVPTAWRNVNNKGKISDTPGYKGFSNADIDNAEKFKQAANERVASARNAAVNARPSATPDIAPDIAPKVDPYTGSAKPGALEGLGGKLAGAGKNILNKTGHIIKGIATDPLSLAGAADIYNNYQLNDSMSQGDLGIGTGIRMIASGPTFLSQLAGTGAGIQQPDLLDKYRDFTSRNIIEPVIGAFKPDNQKANKPPVAQNITQGQNANKPQVQQTQPSLAPVSRQPITANPVEGIQTPSTLGFDNGRKTLAGQGYSLSATNQKPGQSTPESLTALDKTIAYNATPEAKAQFAANAAINNERAERNRAFDAEHAPSGQAIQPQVADYSGAINDAQAQLNWLAQTGPMGNSHSDRKAHQQQLAMAQAQLSSLMGLQGGAQEQGLGMARLDAQQRAQAQSNQLAQQQLQYGAQRDQQAGLAAAEQQNYERQRNRQNDNKLIPKTVTKVDDNGVETQEVKFFNPLTGEEVLSPKQQQEAKNTQISTNAHDIINNPDNPAHKDPAKVARAKAWFETPAGKTWLSVNKTQ
jgi:hypothetical protein